MDMKKPGNAKWSLSTLALLIGVLLGGCPLTEDPIAQTPCEIPEGVLLVDQANDSGDEDGRSWESAFTTVQAAVDAATTGEEVWVAAGTYKSGGNETLVLMADGVSVLGGFAGGECSAAERDWIVNPTTLDGDSTGDGPTSDDAWHVVEGASGARFSGFQVTGGYGDFPCGDVPSCVFGSAMYNIDVSNLSVDHVIFHGNAGFFAPVSNVRSSVSFADTIYFGNTGTKETGGLLIGDSEVALNNIAFVSNHGGGASEGGALTETNSTVMVTNASAVRNNAHEGGAIWQNGGSVTIVGATFRENSAYRGGALQQDIGSLWLTNTSFEGNMAAVVGGALHLWADATITSSTFAYNEADFVEHEGYDFEGAAIFTTDGEITITNSALYGNLDHNDEGVGGPAPADTFAVKGSAITTSYTCNETGLSGTGNVTLAGLPFEQPNASGELFLDPAGADTGCIDAGDNDAADAAIGEGLWEAQTTRADGMSEADVDGMGTEQADAGRHYDPFAVRIDSFSADGANATWTGAYADNCFLFNDANKTIIAVPEMDLYGGTLAHAQAGGTELFFICMGSAGEPAVATAINP
ncbi:MAG: DUF1565 domain-containing protein [Chrysiogenetes bacterium]|nr:DUF1565 domain-containing protein [Chrysiogenetes bacterium]